MFLSCLFLCSSFPVWLFFWYFAALFVWPWGFLKLQLLLKGLFGPHNCSRSPLLWPLSHSSSKLGAWEDIPTGQRAKSTVPYVPWHKLYHSCSLSSQFTVTHNQGYSLHCHTVIRDKMCKSRDFPLLLLATESQPMFRNYSCFFLSLTQLFIAYSIQLMQIKSCSACVLIPECHWDSIPWK